MRRKSSVFLAVSIAVSALTLGACRGRIVDSGDGDPGDDTSPSACRSTDGGACEGQGDGERASDASTTVDANWHSIPAVTPCGELTCTGGDICVVTTSGGGACLMPEDGGLCPDGQPPIGQCCNQTTTVHTCEHRPSTCTDGVSCACAAQLCESCGVCQDVNSPNTIGCPCFYP